MADVDADGRTAAAAVVVTPEYTVPVAPIEASDALPQLSTPLPAFLSARVVYAVLLVTVFVFAVP